MYYFFIIYCLLYNFPQKPGICHDTLYKYLYCAGTGSRRTLETTVQPLVCTTCSGYLACTTGSTTSTGSTSISPVPGTSRNSLRP